jgi:hypothetical protein
MGAGAWSASTYASTTGTKKAAGTTFGYSTSTRSTVASGGTAVAHETLDPKKLNSARMNIRESRDNAEHPTSTPIAVIFDETGSMQHIPSILQDKLAGLYGLLLRRGYVEHPQILVGGYGDCEVDSVPLQVSQFESDNRVDDNLDNIYLEGAGGGNRGESQCIAWYYLAHHTATDRFEKGRGKGYAFFIGDEVSLRLRPEQVKTFIGDGEPLGSLELPDLVSALNEKWDAYVLVIDNHAAHAQKSVEFYTELFGIEHVLIVQDENAIAETIAGCIGLAEGIVDVDALAADLHDIGASDEVIATATAALAVKGTTSVGKRGPVVSAPKPTGVGEDDDEVTRV